MKYPIKTAMIVVLALASCQLALADLSTQIATSFTSGAGSNWVADPGGNSPFYSSANVQTESFSGVGQQTPTAGAPASVLAETITIASTAGVPTTVANTNYILTGISLLLSGSDTTHAYSIHIFDVTSNLTGGVIASGASYNFTSNGDLLGGGNGSDIFFTNQFLSGAVQQDYFGLKNGPNFNDQIVLGAGHTYAIEVWFPTGSSTFFAQKCSAAPVDAGGELMASVDSRLTQSRITGSASGFYGSSEHTWAIALYGSSTNAPFTVNLSTNGPAATTNFIVDDFSTNGVGPQNPTNHDYYTSSNNYAGGQITNVWWNWFGSAFSNTAYAAGISPSYAPSQGSLALQANWTGTANQQFQVWNQGVTNNFYALNISALTYTNFQCDVMYAPGSATNASGNFGLLQFGNRTPGYTSDYFGGGNNGITVAGTNAGAWQHVSIALNPATDTNLLNIQGLLIHTFDGSGTLNGPSKVYIDNIKFTGPQVIVQIPPPVMSIQPVTPGLRMFVGSSATYIREGLITKQGTGENESWVGTGTHYPVTYSFQLLSYPSTGIGITELAILPEAAFNPTANFQTTIYQNPFLDYQDSNGLYVAIAPFSGNGSVTAAVQWKVGLPSANPTNTVLTITNSTAIGTWTLTMNNATQGTLTAPGGASGSFTISDPNLASDFANPAVAYFFEDPNSTAGYGLYEDVGTVSITGVASGTQTENFSTETDDFDGGAVSPHGYFQNDSSVDPANLVISRKGLDAYWFSWTQDLQNNYALTTATNVLVPLSEWISPIYYSGYNMYDETPPRGVGVNHAPNYWELLPEDCLPTVNGAFQPGAPAITVPLAPNAFFIMTTNQANIFPVIP